MMDSNELHPSCKAVQEELLERFDEGTFENLSESASKHISVCPGCRNELQELIALSKDLEKLPAPIPGDEYWIYYLPRLRERLDSRQKTSLLKRPAWAPSLTIAALFSLVVVFSPVKIAPPSWFQADKMVSTAEHILQEEELSKLEQSLYGTDTSEAALEPLELNLIFKLSQSQYEVQKDLYDQLAEMDDQTLEKILAQLNAQPII